MSVVVELAKKVLAEDDCFQHVIDPDLLTKMKKKDPAGFYRLFGTTLENKLITQVLLPLLIRLHGPELVGIPLYFQEQKTKIFLMVDFEGEMDVRFVGWNTFSFLNCEEY